MRISFSAILLATAAVPSALAQGPAFQTPGMPSVPSQAKQAGPDSGQADRFSNAFNPAFSFIVDAALDYVDLDSGSDEDGFDLSLRILEVASQAWVDPSAWAYFVGAAEEEGLNIEEAAVHYVGLGSQTTLRAGRFFIDFGKQMQTHVHELRTLERPLALRAYLGDEVKGDGVQYDQWAAVGDKSALRWSLGVFANLLPEEAAYPVADVALEIDERKDLGDLNFTGRVTAFRDVSENGTLQLGASARIIPEYTVLDEVNDLSEAELGNEVFGVDLTYGWIDDTGQRRWTLGVEALANSGDIELSVLDPDGTPANGDESLNVKDETVFGFYGFLDYAWSKYRSAGVQYSRATLSDAAETELSEIELYTTRWLSEYHRLRLVGVWSNDDTADEDSYRVALQYTAIIGSHGHGINW